MPVVRIGASRQVVIPKKIHDQLGLEAGDYLEVELQEGKVVFTPRALVDKRIEEGLEDIKRGRVYGPFHSAQELIHSLHGSSKKSRRPKKS
ncbi:MAG: AbrB/MazE/SpoVT family DNA-binding domain-containing protein [Candidatus Latescibacteria bacterium]|nr:AbrB/MazE/SpoVT family DNA-binding domain-containing protein [Candidatus Latescibacterota bacterium]